MARGLLIAVEGIDGAGTTTQSRRLVDALTAAGVAAHWTREPSDGPVGLLLRRILAGEFAPVDATTLSLLFAADRADHCQREVEPALAAGKVVISDRWYHSSLAYQGTGEARAWIRELNRRALVPDLTLFLEVGADQAAARRAAAARTDEIFDALPLQRKIAAGYREVVAELQASERIVVVDGEQPLDAVAAELWARVRETCQAAGLGPR
jgi:dTMP kinase